MGECGFEGVVGSEDVDVDDGFHGIGRELGDWGEEVSSRAGAAIPFTVLAHFHI